MTIFDLSIFISLLVVTLCRLGIVLSQASSINHAKIITIPLIPHAVVRERRRSAGETLVKVDRPSYSKYHTMRDLSWPPEAAKAALMAGLFQGYGTHYADLWCGTPPQRQTVIVDTGSGITAFPCNECGSCGVAEHHIDHLFDETQSSSFQKLSCSECFQGTCAANECAMSSYYQEDSSWNAFEASDLCYIGGFHDRPTPTRPNDDSHDNWDRWPAPDRAFSLTFGCQTHLTKAFVTQLADGILGMDGGTPAFWYQMYEAGKIPAKAFSLCFSRKDEADPKGTEAGAMSLGGTDERLHSTPLVYSTTKESSGFYIVHVRKMYLRAGGGGISALSKDEKVKIVQLDVDEMDLNEWRVIVDSGTTVRLFVFSPVLLFQC
jgi:Xylanase inhibitor N-terminal